MRFGWSVSSIRMYSYDRAISVHASICFNLVSRDRGCTWGIGPGADKGCNLLIFALIGPYNHYIVT